MIKETVKNAARHFDSRKEERGKKTGFWTEITSRDKCKPETLGECSDNNKRRTWELLDGVGEGPTRGEMFCFGGGGCQRCFCREHLHDFTSAEYLRGGYCSEGRI